MNGIDFRLQSPELLFGNDAAEDETQDVFASYAIHRSEIDKFVDIDKPLQIVRAYKGEGKSALIRLVENRLKQQSPSPVVVRTTGQAISPSLETGDSDSWVRAWKRNILQHIAVEIGSAISFAYTDDAISLVEEAERNGFKARSFVSAVTDRLSSKHSPIERERLAMTDSGQVLKRFLKNGSPIWLFIDDLDQNFRNEPIPRIKVASCFIAVRQIFSQIPEIRIRVAIRPNVWAIIKPEFEALSHVEQYIVDLAWEDGTFLDLIAKRVQGYLQRTDQWMQVAGALPISYTERFEYLLGLAFESPVQWGPRRRPMYVVLHTLSRHRPRALVELCKVSAKEAYKKGRAKIALDDVVTQLDAFGQRRVEDMIAECKPQCPDIESLIRAFSGQNERYTTDELMRTIDSRIVSGMRPRIHGAPSNPSNRDIAQFLFQIGFLSARKDHSDGTYDHFAFAERPNLLRITTNVDEGMSWEIHPVFRQYLRLKDVVSKSELAGKGRR